MKTRKSEKIDGVASSSGFARSCLLDKVVKLVRGGFVINGAYPVYFFNQCSDIIHILQDVELSPVCVIFTSLTLLSRLGLDVSLDQLHELEEDVNVFVVMYDGKEGLPEPEVWQEVEGRWRELFEDADRAEEERRKAKEREDGESEDKEIGGREGLGKGEEGKVEHLRKEL